MTDAFLVGVDGGGTHCRVRIRTVDGRNVGEAQGGAANVFSALEPALATILDTVRAALAAGGESERALPRCYVGFGLAGANVPSVAAAFHAQALPFAAYRLETDAVTAQRGAFAGDEGAIAILGTGTAYVVKARGRVEILGGFGPMVSDQGGGADLGRRALAQALLAFDGVIESTALTRALMAEFADRPHGVAEFARDAQPRDFGRFAPLVWDHAEQGDAVGARLVGEALAVIEGTLRCCLDRGAPGLALLGGQAVRYRPRLSPSIASAVGEPAGDALDGALDLARALMAAQEPPA